MFVWFGSNLDFLCPVEDHFGMVSDRVQGSLGWFWFDVKSRTNFFGSLKLYVFQKYFSV